jgi:hypothetical protein
MISNSMTHDPFDIVLGGSVLKLNRLWLDLSTIDILIWMVWPMIAYVKQVVCYASPMILSTWPFVTVTLWFAYDHFHMINL